MDLVMRACFPLVNLRDMLGTVASLWRVPVVCDAWKSPVADQLELYTSQCSLQRELATLFPAPLGLLALTGMIQAWGEQQSTCAEIMYSQQAVGEGGLSVSAYGLAVPAAHTPEAKRGLVLRLDRIKMWVPPLPTPS